jgi:hypothetical protein
MGGDGGVIVKDRRFLRSAVGNMQDEKEGAGPNKVTASERQWSRSCCCAISSQELSDPIVACELGNLYNKDAVISAILDKRIGALFSHIRGMKDIKSAVLTLNPEYQTSNAADMSKSEKNPSKFICPISRVEFNGNQPFVIIWSTGYVLSERAVKEIGSEALQAEYGPFSDSDIVKLLASEDETLEIAAKLNERREAKEAKLKEKKDKKRKQESVDADLECSSSAAQSVVNNNFDPKKSQKVESAKIINNKSGGGAGGGGSSSSSSSGGVVTFSSSKSVAQSAVESVENAKKNSSVFKSLFRDSDKDTSSRDLFINVAGMRYNLG